MSFKVPAEIIPNALYVGSLLSASRVTCDNLGISHIVSLAGSLPDDMGHLMILKKLVKDDMFAELYPLFSEFVAFIQNAIQNGGRVLVHCLQGQSRSVTIVCAFLMKSHRLSMTVALAKIRESRPQACPNPNFGLQLKKWEKKLGIPGLKKNVEQNFRVIT